MKSETRKIATNPILLRLEKQEVLFCEKFGPNFEFANVAISFFLRLRRKRGWDGSECRVVFANHTHTYYHKVISISKL